MQSPEGGTDGEQQKEKRRDATPSKTTLFIKTPYEIYEFNFKTIDRLPPTHARFI